MDHDGWRTSRVESRESKVESGSNMRWHGMTRPHENFIVCPADADGVAGLSVAGLSVAAQVSLRGCRRQK
jgi:hypothetical protein